MPTSEPGNLNKLFASPPILGCLPYEVGELSVLHPKDRVVICKASSPGW